eukprot:2514131-Pleurochrysis_carterae.AAC.1
MLVYHTLYESAGLACMAVKDWLHANEGPRKNPKFPYNQMCDALAARTPKKYLLHKAARLVRGDDEANDDPTCAHHAISNIFEEGRKAMDAVLCEMMIHRRDGGHRREEGQGDADE